MRKYLAPHQLFLNRAIIRLSFMCLFFSALISSNNSSRNRCSSHHVGPTTTSSPSGERKLVGRLSSEDDDTRHAARDFGNSHHSTPSSVLHPRSTADIAAVVGHVFRLGGSSNLTVAARGHGHSFRGEALAPGGIVVRMESLAEVVGMRFLTDGEFPSLEVCGGELWIDVLHETLKLGLAPKSWTDYLRLTVGGTLSNAGISGQAFRHGPQISNVYQLEVVTGKGETVNCSETQNADLFNGVLGGLGQFGIITKARIALEPAPVLVKWVRVLYSDFPTFTRDQEWLISTHDSFDYVEGFVIINKTGLINNWRYSFRPRYPLQATQFNSQGKTLFCLEIAKYFFNPQDADSVNKRIDELLLELSFIESTMFQSEVSYVEFLERVHSSELKLREKGLWDVPHPWLNLLVPSSQIQEFAQEVFGSILKHTSNGPILMYPVNKSKWNNRTSAVTPNEDIFYLVAFLSSAVSNSTGKDGLEHILTQNKRILEFCDSAGLEVKQYLPYYRSREEWESHFGDQWEIFVRRKLDYDPLAILAPGLGIFQKSEVLASI